MRRSAPALTHWLDDDDDDERRRGTPEGIVLSVLPALLVSQVGTACLSKFPDGEAAVRMMDAIKVALDGEWARGRGQVQAHRPQGPGGG